MAELQLQERVGAFGPRHNGILMTAGEFDRAKFKRGWRYELIHGVLVVSPTPLVNETDPNEELGHLLRAYRDDHPQGSALDGTLPEQTVRTKENRRRADRIIYAGLGHKPPVTRTPTIAVEFVSSRKRDRVRDYITKRDEYMEIGVKEYWVIDRFMRTMTVFTQVGSEVQSRVIQQNETYETPLLPGFDPSLARLFALAESWPTTSKEAE